MLGGGIAGGADLSYPVDILYHMMKCQDIKLGGRARREAMVPWGQGVFAGWLLYLMLVWLIFNISPSALFPFSIYNYYYDYY